METRAYCHTITLKRRVDDEGTLHYAPPQMDSAGSVTHIASGDLWAGAEVQLFMLARAQQQLGADVSVILLNDGLLATKLAAAGIAVHILPERSLAAPDILRRMIPLLRRLAPDVVHTHRMKENIVGSLAALANGIPSVRTTHGAAESALSGLSLAKRTVRTLDRVLGARLQKRVIAVTTELRGRLAAFYPRRRLITIENGIDPAAFSTLAPGAALSPTFTQAPRRIGFVGRLVPVKRADLFIAAAAQFAAADTSGNVHFFLIGDGPLRESLVQAAARLRGQVHFLGELSTVHPYIAALDALVMCSDHEGLPMTLLEAMSLRVPVIGHDVGGITDLLDQGRCGKPVSDHSATGYAQAMRSVLDDPNTTRQRTDAAYENVSSRYSAQRCAQRHLELYAQVRKRS